MLSFPHENEGAAACSIGLGREAVALARPDIPSAVIALTKSPYRLCRNITISGVWLRNADLDGFS